MKKSLFTVAGCMVLAAAFTACGGQKKTQEAAEETAAPAATTTINVSTTPNGAETQALELPTDADGYITIFDGKTFNGWRGYGKDQVPARWTIEDGCIKFNGTGTGEGQTTGGGDLIFAHKFKNFELTFEYKISKGGNSGIFVLAQEVPSIRCSTTRITQMLRWVRMATVRQLLCMT